jgi:hypothetical protein
MADNEKKTITLVLERRQLWNTRNKNYHNTAISTKLWDKTAMEIILKKVKPKVKLSL